LLLTALKAQYGDVVGKAKYDSMTRLDRAQQEKQLTQAMATPDMQEIFRKALALVEAAKNA
jgi:hypothetical protein